MSTFAYLLPLRRATFAEVEVREFANYLDLLCQTGCEVIVIDGSSAPVFRQHKEAFDPGVTHIEVDRSFGYLNDKVNGIQTGVAYTRQEKIILADDDIRYTPTAIALVIESLDRYDVVRPQNYFSSLPRWAKMEAARMLINRALLRTGDYPGTSAFRRSTFQRAGDYDGDVLFDNEEIIRHFAKEGASICFALDLLVPKRPPTFRKWLEQRPRQAYEDFGLRLKTALFFSLPILSLGTLVLLGLRGLLSVCMVIALTAMALAWRGRLRGRAASYFPLPVVLAAPFWVAERTISTYWALYWFVRYRGYPFGGRILEKGIGRDWRSGGAVIARGESFG